MFDNSLLNRVLLKGLCALLLPACMLYSVATARSGARQAPTSEAPAFELPAHWQGRALRPLALSEVEQRFARGFPGTLARLTDGEQVLVLRAVQRPTRMLHPAADCYRALGYAIDHAQLRRDAQAQLWRCFEARRSSTALQVCERINDAGGAGFTDTSAWYWAALLGQSQGPWQAITVARTL
jgi:hypothetical protein